MNKLEVRGLAVRYGTIDALRGVELELAAGEVVALAGPNGAGKSTLLKYLLGLVQPTAGELRVDGAARAVDNTFKQKVGYLPEAVAFADNLDGDQVLQFFARARGVPRERVERVLERVGLREAARRRVRGYSRGMRQRLGLGIAILSEPELLILDEPTGGLDQQGLEVLWNVLAEWRAAERMVLMATHDLTLVERRVDRLCLLVDGSVRASDTPSRLRERVGLSVRVTFRLAAGAGDDSFLERLRHCDEVTAFGLRDDTVSVEVAPDRLLPLLERQLLAPGVVCGVRVEEPGLDVVYEHLLQGAA